MGIGKVADCTCDYVGISTTFDHVCDLRSYDSHEFARKLRHGNLGCSMF